MKIGNVIASVAASAAMLSSAALSGPLDTLFDACKIECLPAFSAVSACVYALDGEYTATFVPSNMTVTTTGNQTELVQCGCGEDVKTFAGKCVDCVNAQGCFPVKIDYNRLCTDGEYPKELFTTFHSGLQCQKPAARRYRRSAA